MRVFALIIFLSLTEGLFAQSSSTLLGARAAGIGNATSTLQQDEWAVFNNIAGLASLANKTFAATYDVRPNLEGANRLGALAAIPISFGVGGFGLFRFGDDLYNEQIITAGFANTIGNTSLGVKLSYIQYRAAGYGTHSTLGINIGGITQITPKLKIGAWIQNINQPKLNFKDEERAPVKMNLGISFKPAETFFINTEIEKDVLYKPTWKTGMEYLILKKFSARLGFNLQPNTAFGGIGYRGNKIKIDYAIQGFNQLGTSHQASASYILTTTNKKK